MTGLEQLHRMASGLVPPPPFTDHVPLRMTYVSPGRVVFEYEPRADHGNGLGSVHGGIVTTVLDTAMGCAAQSVLEPGESYATVELKTTFVRAVTPEAGPLRAEGVVLHRGARVASAEARLTDGDGVLYAHATSTVLLRAEGAPRAAAA